MPKEKKVNKITGRPAEYSIKAGDKVFNFKTKKPFANKLRTLAADMGQLTRTPSRTMKDSDVKIMTEAMKRAKLKNYRSTLKIK